MVNHPVHTTCVICSEHLSNHYIGPLMQGTVAAAAEFGVRLILYTPFNISLSRREFTLADLPLLPQSVDSYLLPSNSADEVITYCRKTGATVMVYGGMRTGLSAIGPDNRAGGRMATAHLLDHGRRRIVHLAGLPDSDEAHERLAGYREALEAAGIAYDRSLVVYGYFRVQEAEDAVSELLRDGISFDAIFAANDLEARGAMNVLARAGLRVPDDVAVVGFDDAAGSDLLDPPLTSVRQSAFQIGWDAVALLAQSTGRPIPQRVSTDVRLVVRRSCGCSGAAESRTDIEQLAERFGSAQGPLIHASDVLEWTAQLDEVLTSKEGVAAGVTMVADRVARRGGHVPALRALLNLWRDRHSTNSDDPWPETTIVNAANEALAALLETQAVREQVERARRLDATTYVLDLLREYNSEQAIEPVLRYMADSGPIAAISVHRSGTGNSTSAQRVSSAGIEQWNGSATAFPPMSWLSPGEVLLLTPVESGMQRMLFGVVEGAGCIHLALDDQLLRSINTYRSITVLQETRRELDAARSVQLSLLPREAPASPLYDIASATRAARQVGGDLYGYYARPGGKIALALGDVAGKGMPAALLMSACATALAGTIQRGQPPGQTLVLMHHLLQPSVGRGQNAAICLVYLDGGRAHIANAGSVAPIVRDRQGVHIIDVGGLPLGTPLSGLLPYAEVSLDLAPGDFLILSSDGIVEAMNRTGTLYGFERFMEAIRNGPHNNAQKMLDHLFDEVLDFVGGIEMHDDMAIVVAHYLGEGS